MHFLSVKHLDGRITEREFTIGDISGIVWTPATSSFVPAPLILMGQPGGIGMRRMYPRLAARALGAAARGFASVSIELPGGGDRSPLPGVERARTDLRRAITAGERPGADVIDRLVLPRRSGGARVADHARRGPRPSRDRRSGRVLPSCTGLVP